MRITIHLDTFDRVDPCAYAILWLDKESHKWSREGHMGLNLPEWGTYNADRADTLICGPHGARPLCVLEGLELDRHDGPFEGETGRAEWHRGEGLAPELGHWHVQYIDDACVEPEHGLFAGSNTA
jgi:hypothetical protein